MKAADEASLTRASSIITESLGHCQNSINIILIRISSITLTIDKFPNRTKRRQHASAKGHTGLFARVLALSHLLVESFKYTRKLLIVVASIVAMPYLSRYRWNLGR